MGTLNVINNFELTSQGRTVEGKQGEAAGEFDEAFAIDVAGTLHEMIGTLADDAVATVFDDDDDHPADFDYLYYWADQDSYIQIIGPSMQVTFKVLAKTPFVLSFDQIHASASATAITGAAEPTMSDIDSVVIGNYSGNAMNYHFAAID